MQGNGSSETGFVPRPVLVNSWEAAYFNFTGETIVELAREAAGLGIDMVVMDDGWFGKREDDNSGLGDWQVNEKKLGCSLSELVRRVNAEGVKFGIWIEPEMISEDSDLYREHPDWAMQNPGRNPARGRNQLVLDFSREDVREHIFDQICRVLDQGNIEYIKWDMNRSITECYSAALPPKRQGEVFHRYILGVYELYERLNKNFPHILFESCASGGGRVDPGVLYYAPQGWASDDSDAVERLKIQYGTSFCYPISSIGSHVSVTPNHQVFRNTPLSTRANVAYFGTFGYELDLNKLSEEQQEIVKKQTAFMKEYRKLLQFGTFYRLVSPFDSNITCWMVVSGDKKEAIVGWYRILSHVNMPYTRVKLYGLNPDFCYEEQSTKNKYFGDELMNIGLITSDGMSGQAQENKEEYGDFASRLYVLRAVGEL